MRICLLFSFCMMNLSALAQVFNKQQPLAHTYSIVCRDSATGDLGVAVQSHWFSVGTVVSWAEAGVGAIATQSFVNKSFGPRGLALMKAGKTAGETLELLLADDEGRDVRQVAIADARGNVAVYTGKKCIEHAGHVQGENFSVQANMMLTDKVPGAMAKAFRASSGKPLAERMLAALDAAEAAGGDIRGQQSAALLVVPGLSKDEPWNERTVDLRVDDHPTPLVELRRLYRVHTAYEFMNLGDLAVEKSDMSAAMEYYRKAMNLFPQNLEMQYWTAITLANNGQVAKAIPMLKKIFAADMNWKELTRRLPTVGLLNLGPADFDKIMKL